MNVNRISTTILIENAALHRYSLAGEYIGFLKANKIIYIVNTATGEILVTLAVGNVKFLRYNIYITSHCALQDIKDGLITFKFGGEDKDKGKDTDKDKDKGKVKIIDVRDSVKHIPA